MEVMEAIKTRRSIRKYKTTPVDDKTFGLFWKLPAGRRPGLIDNAVDLLWCVIVI